MGSLKKRGCGVQKPIGGVQAGVRNAPDRPGAAVVTRATRLARSS